MIKISIVCFMLLNGCATVNKEDVELIKSKANSLDKLIFKNKYEKY